MTAMGDTALLAEELASAFADITHARWGNPAWPAKFRKFEPHQINAVIEVIAAYRDGADVVMLDAPVGSGKTVIAEAVRRLLSPTNALYVAHTNGLVNQFMSDFGSYAKPLKGRSNYPTADKPELFDARIEERETCADCNLSQTTLPACNRCDPPSPDDEDDGLKSHCDLCHPPSGCPYRRARIAALGVKDREGFYIEPPAALAVTNTAYFITEANGPGGSSGVPFVIADECDTLESIMMGNVTVEFSRKARLTYDVGVPEGKTIESTWLEWVREDALPKMKLAHARLKLKKKTMALHKEPIPKTLRREIQFVEGMISKLTILDGLLLEDNAIYQYEGGDDESAGRSKNVGDIKFIPIRVNTFGPTMLWKHARRFLCMSGTIIDAREFVESLGIEEAGLRWEVVTVPMTFPVENRPIVVRSIANMVYKEKEVEWPKMVEGIRAVMHKHPNDRILVHTVSYAFSKFCHERLRSEPRDVYVYSGAKERERVLENFRRAPGGVLLAPSMDRGVDLPHDDCRVVIVTKMPFMSLGDKRVKRRMYGPGGQLWYSVSTVRSLVQMTGRHVRNKEDRGISYILDKQFTANVWKKNKRLLPEYWRDALDFSGGGLEVPAE